MADLIQTGYGEGHFANADYIGNNTALQGYTVNIANGFHAPDFQGGAGLDIPAGDYKVVEQAFHDKTNQNNMYVVLQDTNGNKYNVPNQFFSSQDVYVTDKSGNKYPSHGSYVELWANSQVEGDKLGSNTGVSAELNAGKNTGAASVGYNTYKNTSYQEHSVFGDNVELGLQTRDADSISGQKIYVEGDRVYDAPYRAGDVVVAPDGKQYYVDNYTAKDGANYNVTLKPVDGGDSIDVSTADMNGKYYTVTSAIEKGSEFGYHAEERKVQDAFLEQRNNGQLTTSSNTMSIGAMKNDKAAGNFYGKVTTTDGKEVDAYVSFAGDGKDPIITNSQTGERITGIKDEVKVYTVQEGDHNALATGYVGADGAKEPTKTGIASGGKYYEPGEGSKSEVGAKYIYKKADGTEVVVEYKSNDGSAGFGKTPNAVTGTYTDEEGHTYHLTDKEVTRAKEVDSGAVYGTNNGYNVTSILTDQRTDYGYYKEGDKWFYDQNGTHGALNPTGAVSTSREKSEMYDNAMYGHNLTEKATLTGLTKGTEWQNPQAAIGALVNTKHWTRKDATIFVNDSIKSGAIKVKDEFDKKDNYYQQFAEIHKEFKGEGSKYLARAKTLEAEVDTLEANTDRTLFSMDGWHGKASKQCSTNIKLVQGRLLEAKLNIHNTLTPAMQAIAEMDEKMTALEKEDLILTELLEAQETAKTAMDEAKTAYEKAPEPKTVTTTNADGTTSTHTEHANDKADALAVYNAKKEEYDKATEAVEEQQEKESQMAQEILGLIETVKALDQTMESLGDHVNEGGKYVASYASADSFARSYQKLMADFQSPDRFPTMTNLSDYKLGDKITLDDAYGYLYKVVEIFDGDGNATGSIKIVRCDDKGNPIKGSPILTIHDQREIAPVSGGLGRELWTPPITVSAVPQTSDPPKNDDQKKPDKPGNTKPVTTPPGIDLPTTQPVTTKPPTTQPVITKPPTTSDPVIIPTKPTTPTREGTQPVLSEVPLPDPVVVDPSRLPDPDTPYAPGTTYISGDGDVEFMPYTGIDQAVNNAFGGDTDVKRAGAGALGALAGVMAGAAGIGLTALSNDKDKEEEKKESDENSSEAI